MGVHPIASLPSVMAQHVTVIKKNITEAMKDVAAAGAYKIIESTPVDTSKAVANWKVTQNSPFGGVVGERIPGSKKGSGASAARSSMKAEVAGRLELVKSDTTIYIANNVPYIGILEYGDSKHRPHGMVAKGLQAMRTRASSIRILTRKV